MSEFCIFDKIACSFTSKSALLCAKLMIYPPPSKKLRFWEKSRHNAGSFDLWTLPNRLDQGTTEKSRAISEYGQQVISADVFFEEVWDGMLTDCDEVVDISGKVCRRK